MIVDRSVVAKLSHDREGRSVTVAFFVFKLPWPRQPERPPIANYTVVWSWIWPHLALQGHVHILYGNIAFEFKLSTGIPAAVVKNLGPAAAAGKLYVSSQMFKFSSGNFFLFGRRNFRKEDST